jgi:hypothetical protein
MKPPYPIGAYRPDHDVAAIACAVNWMQEAQDYLAQGGETTKHTNQKEFEHYRCLARSFIKSLSKWLDKAAWEPKKSPSPSAASKISQLLNTDKSSEHHMSGLIFFIKGDYAKANQELLLSKQLDPSNKDVLESLEFLKKYLPVDASIPAP